MLHIRNNGMNKVRAIENVARVRGDVKFRDLKEGP